MDNDAFLFVVLGLFPAIGHFFEHGLPLLGLFDATEDNRLLLLSVIVLFEAVGPIFNWDDLIESNSTGEGSQIFDLLFDLFFNNFVLSSLLHHYFVRETRIAFHLLVRKALVPHRIRRRFTTSLVLFVEFTWCLVKVRLRLVNTDTHCSHPLFVFLPFFLGDLRQLHSSQQGVEVGVHHEWRL